MHGGGWFFRPVGTDGDAAENERSGGGEGEVRGEINFHEIIWKEYLVNALAIGVPYDSFWHLTPAKLESFYRAHKLKMKLLDEQAYMQGIYFMEALKATVCNAPFWRGKGQEPYQYPKKPFAQESVGLSESDMSEEEKQKQVDLFFAQESARRANWRRTHHKSGEAS